MSWPSGDAHKANGQSKETNTGMANWRCNQTNRDKSGTSQELLHIAKQKALILLNKVLWTQSICRAAYYALQNVNTAAANHSLLEYIGYCWLHCIDTGHNQDNFFQHILIQLKWRRATAVGGGKQAPVSHKDAPRFNTSHLQERSLAKMDTIALGITIWCIQIKWQGSSTKEPLHIFFKSHLC